MDSNTTAEISTAIAKFERALEELVIDSYIAGVPVEGTWNVTVPVTDAPDWTISIEKKYSEESAPYEPTLLEE